MDRQIVYPAQIPLDSDLLNAQRNAFVGLGHLAGMAYGDSTVAAGGFACTPGTGLAVTIAPGSLLAAGVVDGTAYGTLAANGSMLVRQHISRDPVTLTVPGAGAAYTVYATPATVDADATVLPFYNAADPSVTYAGADNSGKAAPTVRQDVAQLGIAAAVPDGAYPLWTITVPAGVTALTADMIAQAEGAPFYQTIPELQASKISKAGDGMTGPLTVLNATAAQNPVALGQLATLTPGRLLKVQRFNTAGTSPFTPTPGANFWRVHVQAGGGGGGSAAYNEGDSVSVAHAGGGGTYAMAEYTEADMASAIAAGITVTAGAGGARLVTSGAINGLPGNNGEASSFGSLLTCPGGLGGNAGTWSNSGQWASANSIQSAAATGSGIVQQIRGGSPGASTSYAFSQAGLLSWPGGASAFGPGAPAVDGASGNVYDAINPGSGGSGVCLPQNSANAMPGGAGADGLVWVEEWILDESE